MIHTKTSWSLLSFNVLSVQKLSSSKNVFPCILNPRTEGYWGMFEVARNCLIAPVVTD